MSDRLSWERDGRDWPNRESSRFVDAGGLRWHVQVMGEEPVAQVVGAEPVAQPGAGPVAQPGAGPVAQVGAKPVVLLIHGTGASTHSFRALAKLLVPDFTVVVPDLPGHGFTDGPASGAGYSLPGVAAGLAALLQVLGLQPTLAVGHSAGAAVALRMALDGSITPAAVVSLNGALLPFPGPASEFFRPAARLLASSRLTAKAFSLFAGASPSVERMLRSTGSRIDLEGRRLYARLAGNAGHVHAALALMANWDLRPLARDLPRLASHLILVTGSQDGMVPPAESYRVRALVPKAELVSLRGLGHLAHEERPDEVAALLQRTLPQEAAGPHEAAG